MRSVYVFCADGFEEVEGLTAVDLLRRAGVSVTMVSIMGRTKITGARNISVNTDILIEDIKEEADMLVLPGGMPGVTNLIANEKVKNLVCGQYEAGRYVAAICAAPTAFGAFGILKDKKATCYPGMEAGLHCAEVLYDSVVTDGKVITSRGMGTAIDFGLKLVEILTDQDTSEKLAAAIVYK